MPCPCPCCTRRAVRRRVQRKTRVLEGKCYRCGRKRRLDVNECRACTTKRNEQQQKRRARLKAEGLCMRCGADHDRNGIFCEECVVKERTRARKNHAVQLARARRKGLCIKCAAKPTRPGKATCLVCSEKAKAGYRKRRAALAAKSSVRTARRAAGVLSGSGSGSITTAAVAADTLTGGWEG